MHALGRSTELIGMVVEREVDQQKELSTLFRTNSFASKLLKIYTQIACGDFVTAALKPGVDRVLALSEALEVDSSRVSSDVADKNVTRLSEVCEEFISDILKALPVAPMGMRRICSQLANAVVAKFGREERVRAIGIGSYVFLRMLCPVFMKPDKSGFPTLCAPQPHHLRTFILVSKVIQNLANQVLFGKKEPFMAPLNAVVKSQQDRVNTFLLELAQLAPDAPPDPEPTPAEVEEAFSLASMNVIHSFAVSAKAGLSSCPSWTVPASVELDFPSSQVIARTLLALPRPVPGQVYTEGKERG